MAYSNLYGAPILDRGQSFGSGNPQLDKEMSARGYTLRQGGYYSNGAQSVMPGQAKEMLARGDKASAMTDPGSYNPGVDYSAAVNPYLQQSQNALMGGGSSVNTNNEYETRLRQLMDNPDSISDTGAYKFAYNQGQQAIERSAAAKGMSGSGNVLAELMKYGQGMASQQYGAEADRLGALAGTQKNYILGLKSAANQEAGNKSSNYLNMGNLSLSAGKAKSDDYWSAQQAAQNSAVNSGYYKQSIW